MPKRPNYKKTSYKKIFLISLILVILGGGCGGTYYFYKKYNSLKSGLNQKNSSSLNLAAAENASLIAEIGKIMILPTDETPTIATVSDKEKVKDQPFFKKAENGDKLLAYPKNKKAILYRPDTRKIIEVAPIYSEDTKTP